MTFNSIPFLILAIVTYGLTSVCVNRKNKILVLLLASYIFYAYWDIRFVCLMIFDEFICYSISIGLSKKKNKALLTIGVIVLLGILFVFKYFNFVFDSFQHIIGGISDAPEFQVILPIGISFYTFQCLSYLIDVYRGEVIARKRFVEVAFYISFFPQLVAGPIVRAKDFLPQIDQDFWLKRRVGEGIQIFIWGLLKKVVIADRLAVCVDSVYSAPEAYSGASIWIAIMSYSIQILCDFSGYSDMAIGVAKIFGFELCKNFNLPYLSKNPSEFWKRWHISLSQWLKDYLYIPLGGNRKGKNRTYVNLLITMALGGLWHGASWNFIIWGLLHGTALIIHRIYRKSNIRTSLMSRLGRKTYDIVSAVLNFFFISFSWTVFRIESIDDILVVFRKAFLMENGIQYIYVYSVIFIILCIIFYLFYAIKENGDIKYVFLDIGSFKGAFLFLMELWIILLFGYVGNNAFIYFQF